MASYPLMDIEQAITEAQRCLDDITEVVHVLLAASDGHYPIEAPVLLAQVSAARTAVLQILPASLQTELAMEHIRHADTEAWASRWC
jgi:hypothetical protein